MNITYTGPALDSSGNPYRLLVSSNYGSFVTGIFGYSFFNIGSSTASASPTNTLATVLNSLQAVLSAIQALIAR